MFQKTKIFFDVFECPAGTLFIIFLDSSLAGISFTKPEHRKGRLPDSFRKELQGYFAGNTEGFRQKIIFLNGSDFEKNVWLSLREIPYGETRTYKWLSEKIGSPDASRAVGQALGKNPIPIVLPCHRIINSDGSIGGYSPGIDIKRRLLEMEYYSRLAKTG